MADHDQLTDHFLIAMPQMKDPSFERTVTYLCEHSGLGALGIIINRPLQKKRLLEILPHVDLRRADKRDRTMCWGGPVQQERGFVLHSPPGNWMATHPVSDDVGVTTSRDILSAIAAGQGPERSLVAFGYAGWGPGQLEAELVENSWLCVAVDYRVLFDIPHAERWIAAAALLGVDLHTLSRDVGHA